MNCNNQNKSVQVPSEIVCKILGHTGTPFIKKSLRHLSVSLIFQKVPDIWNALARTDGMTISQCYDVLQKKSKLISSIIKKQEKLVTFKTNQKDITQLSVFGDRIFISSDDATLKIFDLNGGILKTLNGHVGGIWSFDSCGDRIVTGSTDKSARIWDMKTQQTLRTLKYHRNTVRIIRSNEDYIISGSRDYTIGVWSSIGDLLYRLEGHTQSVRCLDMSNDYLVSGSYDGYCKLWDYKRGKFIKDIHIHDQRVYCVKIHNNYVGSAGMSDTIAISKIDGTHNISYRLHAGVVGWLDFVGNYVVTSSLEGTVVKYDYINNTLDFKILINEPLRGHKVTDSLIIVATLKDVQVYSFRTGRYIRTLMAATTIYKVEMIDGKIIVGYLDDTEFKVSIFNYDTDEKV